MAVLFFRTDTTDFFKEDRGLDDPSQPRMMRLEAELLRDDLTSLGESIRRRIRPDGWVPNAGATATHGITARQCELWGARVNAVLADFMDMVRVASEIVSWAYPFHAGIIDVELRRLKTKPEAWTRGGLKRTCALREASAKWNSGSNIKLPTALEKAGLVIPSDDKLLASIEIMKVLRGLQIPASPAPAV